MNKPPIETEKLIEALLPTVVEQTVEAVIEAVREALVSACGDSVKITQVPTKV